jgi:hypothetical protein
VALQQTQLQVAVLQLQQLLLLQMVLLLLAVVEAEVSSAEGDECRTSGRCASHPLTVLLCYPPKVAVHCRLYQQQVMLHMLSGGAQMAAGRMD